VASGGDTDIETGSINDLVLSSTATPNLQAIPDLENLELLEEDG
jgi:hypothetical protein